MHHLEDQEHVNIVGRGSSGNRQLQGSMFPAKQKQYATVYHAEDPDQRPS
ncbi:hypothetical protein AALA13_16350 [Lachnospiraceae bacterium 50-23]